jgi:hypothetical protein
MMWSPSMSLQNKIEQNFRLIMDLINGFSRSRHDPADCSSGLPAVATVDWMQRKKTPKTQQTTPKTQKNATKETAALIKFRSGETTVFFGHLYIKNDLFTKTGSGQTWGKLKKQAAF